MPRLVVRQGDRAGEIAFEGSPTLSQLLQQGGYSFAQPCGGRGTCGQCRARAQGMLNEPTAQERKRLTQRELDAGVRLVCQAAALGDASVVLPEGKALKNIAAQGQMPDFTPDPEPGRYGVAVDVGTTTLALRLVDLKRGRLAGAVTGANPQGEIAADVIGRMEAAMRGGGETLHALLTRELDRLLAALARENGIAAGDVDALVIAGNTTMLYLLERRDPAPLSRAPFLADCLFGHWTSGAALGLESVAGARAYLPRCVGAFVGADITCGILSSGMLNKNETALLMDVGTNGEIALWHKGVLRCCATAAGPALEGVGIRMGVGSVAGAIDRVWEEEGALRCTTIGGEEPVGVCGTGILGAAAAFLRLGLMDETGRLSREEIPIGGKVSLTQGDIRSVQLAKAAIAAGVLSLCGAAGIAPEDIQTLYVAGGFGASLDMESAAQIGLVPRALAGRAVVLGNASLCGAAMLLLNRGFEQETLNLAARAACVPLGGSTVFAGHFMGCMAFEEI